jgi:hypothetical protein
MNKNHFGVRGLGIIGTHQGLLFALLFAITSLVNAEGIKDAPDSVEEAREYYGKWEVDIDGGNLIRYSTHGGTVWGHRLSLVKTAGSCDKDQLLLIWSTYEKDLEGLKNSHVEMDIEIGSAIFKSTESRLDYFQPTLDNGFELSFKILIISLPFSLSEEFMLALANTDSAEIKFTGPSKFLDKLDIKSDLFGLDEFKGAQDKARELCDNIEGMS